MLSMLFHFCLSILCVFAELENKAWFSKHFTGSAAISFLQVLITKTRADKDLSTGGSTFLMPLNPAASA